MNFQQKRPRLKERPAFRFTLPPLSPQIKGSLLALLTILLTLSLWSFADQNTPGNWLGLLGAFTGFSLYFLLGAGGYLLLGYLGYLSRRAFQNALYTSWSLPLASFGIFLLSACVLMNLLADNWTHLQVFLKGSVFSDAGNKQWNIHFFLGGTPSQYLYKIVPYLNLKYLLNTLGTALLFGGLMVISFLALVHFDPKQAEEKAEAESETETKGGGC